jgi:membrane-associated phospholipid phosphatase
MASRSISRRRPGPRRPACEPLEARCLLAGDTVLAWNDALLDAVRADGTPPPLAARNMAIVHLAVADAVAAVDRSFEPYAVDIRLPRPASASAAAAAAAHRSLVGLYPDQAAAFRATLHDSLAAIPAGPDRLRGFLLGRHVAQRTLAMRRNDGADAASDYAPGAGPGRWEPTPPAFADALLPQWPDVTPFAIGTGDRFRPLDPPSLGDDAYAEAFEEVKRLGAVDSAARTADQTQIARFWADGAGTATPPGHWNAIAAEVAEARGATLAENARLFATLNVALADAGIASWDAKYAFDLWRPVTAIRRADTDGNPRTEPDPGWVPLLPTPPFPTCTSGHSTFSGAAEAVLSAYFGPETAFATGSEGLPGVTRSFESFAEAAEEAGMSRIYGGIHFQFDNVDGLASGRAVGRHVAASLFRPRDGSGAG